MREGAAVEAATRETLNEWVERWFADRELRGLTSVRDDRSHYTHHVAELLGAKPISGPQKIARDDVEMLVEDLDRKARLSPGTPDAISWKTAMNIWATMSKAFDDAANAKSRRLRVRTDNPAKDVRGPDRGVERAKQFLYPSEFIKLVEHPDVPQRWKRAVTLAIYLFPRDGEQRVLTWNDVDLEHGTVHIHKAWNRRAREEKSTKTKGTRRFAVEKNALPLLVAMHDEAKANDGDEVDDESLGIRPIVEMPSERDMSRGLKRWLRRAGVTRRELFDDTPTTKSLTWHDLRATGLTWMAVRGDEPLKIMQRAGHERFETTQRYVREAENLRTGFGDVFPPLPASLFGTTKEFRSGSGFHQNSTDSFGPISPGYWRGGRDSNAWRFGFAGDRRSRLHSARRARAANSARRGRPTGAGSARGSAARPGGERARGRPHPRGEGRALRRCGSAREGA